MVHDRERLLFGFETADNRSFVDPIPDQLQGYLSFDRGSLLGKPDLPHTTFSKFF